MTNLIEQAINCNDGDLAAKIIRDALGIANDDVANYCFPKSGQLIANCAPALSAIGCNMRPAT